jgi:hydrogenase maturation protease
MIRVIGIGSPFGDDRAGLEVAARIAAAPPPEVEVVPADRPGVDLVELLDGAGAAIVIDAVRSGAPAGTVHDFDLHALPALRMALVSSHGVGVAEAVALARALGRLPARGRLVGIEAPPGEAHAPAELSRPVAESIDQVVRRVRDWVDYFRAAPDDSRSREGEGEGEGDEN